MMWNDPDLDSALNRCRETYFGNGPCYAPAYLEARRAYHELLVKRGFMTKEEADTDARLTKKAVA